MPYLMLALGGIGIVDVRDVRAQLLELCEKHEMHYHWVKGHADNEYNNRCDALAVEQRDRYAK